MRTGRLTYTPEPVARRPLSTPGLLPGITDHPKAAFLGGWWSGIAIGLVIGAGLAVALLHGGR